MHVNDVVVLTQDRRDEELHRGDKGTIVAVFDKPSRAYEVEFCDDEGVTIQQLALEPQQLKLVWSATTEASAAAGD